MSRIEALNVIPFGSLSTATNPAPETVGSPCPLALSLCATRWRIRKSYQTVPPSRLNDGRIES